MNISDYLPISVETDFAAIRDIGEVVDVLREGAMWMEAKNCPSWQISEIGTAFVASRIACSEFVAARIGGEIAGVCTLSGEDALFWPEDSRGSAAYLHKLAVRRRYAGGVVTSALIARCRDIASERGVEALRLDCHPMLRSLYERLGFSYVDTQQVRLAHGVVGVVDRLQILL